MKKVLELNVGDLFQVPTDSNVYMLIDKTYVNMGTSDKVAVCVKSDYERIGKLRFFDNCEEVFEYNGELDVFRYNDLER
jgi:hypothetical protein